MKKLMIAACAVAFAAVAQAANVSWQISGITAAKTGDSVGNYYAFAFITDAGGSATKTFTTEAIVGMLTDYTNPFNTLKEAYGKGGAAVNASGAVTSYATTKGIDVTGASTDNPITLHSYMVIVDTKSLGDLEGTLNNYQVVDMGTVEFKNTASTLTFTGVASNDWQSVPEPTSGLLLLLGVAGLALKRKRA